MRGGAGCPGLVPCSIARCGMIGGVDDRVVEIQAMISSVGHECHKLCMLENNPERPVIFSQQHHHRTSIIMA